MRYIVSEIVLDVLGQMDPKYPEVSEETLARFDSYKKILVDEYGPEIDEKPKKKKSKKQCL